MFSLLFLLLEVQSAIVYVNETIRQPLTDLFGQLENPTYEIQDKQNPYLSIIPQYYQHPDTKTHNQSINISKLDADIIISAKAQTSKGYWTNHFLFLELNKGTYNLHYSENPQEENVATPKFDEHLMVTNSASDVCYDAEQYDDTHYIVDCAIKTDGQPLQNKFLVVSKDQVIKTHTVSNPLNYQSIYKRKISTFYVEDQLYLLQGSMQSGVESIIQFYQINSADISFIEQEHEISTNILKIILGLDNSYKFYLLDFKLVYSQVYVLDKTFVCALSFDKNGDMFLDYYKQLSGNIIAFDYTYYLDDNGAKNSILVILKDKTFDLYYNGLDGVSYQLESTVSANAQIKVSQQFIIIEDENTIYQYKIGNKVLLNKKTLTQINNYLINPIYPDIITISYNLTRRYYISEGYLQIQTSTTSADPKVITITATSKSQLTEYQFTLQILNKNDGQMYQNGRSKQIITDVIYKAGQTQTIIPFVSGPDIEVGADPQDNPLNIEFEIKKEMHIQEWPNPATIHFQDMLQFSDSLVYVLFQLKTKDVQIWECTQTSQDLVESCKLDVTTTFPILTNSLHFQWWIDKQTYLIFCDSNYTAELWSLDQNNTLTKINKIISLTPITQILELHRTLYILIGQDKKIGVYNSNDAMKIDLIDEKTVKSLGMIKSWSPKRMFGNQKYSSHLLFIQNNDNLMVTIYNNQINLVENILITDDIEITLYQNTFFMSRISSGNSILEEYSIKDLNNIYLMRQVQLYNYEFHNPLTVTQSEDNGFLFILAKSQQVLLFRPNEENSNDELFRVFDVQFSDYVTMSSCGYKKTHFYFSNGTNSNYFAILMQPTMLVKSLISVPTEDYFANVTQSLYFKNKLFQYNFGEKIQILNREQTFTFINQEAISVPEGKQSYLVPLNNLYSGQVISLSCDQCNNEIQLITPIQGLISKFLDNVKDIEYYSVNYNAIITKDKLYLVDHQENVQDVFTFGTPNSCEYLQVQQNFTYVIVLCNYNSIYHMYLIICDFSFHCKSQDTPKDLSELQGVSKMILLPDGLILIQDMGKIQVYHIQIQETTWTITQSQIIDTGKGLTDFIVQEYEEKHQYILAMIDQADYLNIFYTEFSGIKLNILSQSSILIYNVIIESNQFAFQTTDYIQLFAIPQQQELHYIIIANDVASVAIKLTLNITNQIQSATVTQVFNPYLDWIALNKAVYLDNSLIVPYTNKVDTLLAFYYFNNSKVTHNFIYGLKDTAFSVTDGLLMIYLFKESSVTHLYSNLMNKVLTSYEVRNFPQLQFQNTSNLQTTQNITLIAGNIINNQSINITINKSLVPPPPPIPDDDNSSSSNWWWITLIVIGSIAIIGVGVVLYMKHKQMGLFKVEGTGYSLHGVP